MASGHLGRVLNRSALLLAAFGLANAVLVFSFLELTEPHEATLTLLGRQKALAGEISRLAAEDPGAEDVLRGPSAALGEILDRLRALGDATTPEVLSAGSRLQSELASEGDATAIAAAAEQLEARVDVAIESVRRTGRTYRRLLGAFAAASSLLVLGLSLAGARYLHGTVTRPARRLQALARRALGRAPGSRRAEPPLEGAVAAVTDLTERLEEVRSERDVAQADYHAFVDNALAGIYRIGSDGKLLLANDALARMLGYGDGEELIAETRDARKELRLETDRRATAADRDVPVAETRMRRRDGEEIWVLASWRSFEDGGVEGEEGIVFDITPRKRAERALRQLSGRLMELQDEERQRIARELHDSMGQLLAAVEMNLTRLEDTETLPGPSSELLHDSLELCQEASRQTRTLSHLLHPPLLEELGLAHALADFVEGFGSRSGIAIELDVRLDERLPPAHETAVFRFVQECLTNVHRHSGSDRAEIRVGREGDELVAECVDHGRGLPSGVYDDGAIATVGVGLRGIQSRVEQFDGRLDVDSDASGTRVAIRLPA